jgi:Divergent InlB B-repeat domain
VIIGRRWSDRMTSLPGSAIVAGSLVLAPATARAAQLTLSWVDNSGGTAGFKIERKTGPSGAYTHLVTVGAGVATYAHPTVVANVTYCYRVKASNAHGDSDYSNEACGSPAAGLDIAVVRVGNGSGIVMSTPAGIDCGLDCTESYAAGRVVTLTAAPASGSSFGGWSGGCTGIDSCILTGNTPASVIATFVLSAPAPSSGGWSSRQPRSLSGGTRPGSPGGLPGPSTPRPSRESRDGADGAASTGRSRGRRIAGSASAAVKGRPRMRTRS